MCAFCREKLSYLSPLNQEGIRVLFFFFFKDALGSVVFWDINSITWLQSQKRIVKGKTSQVNNTDLL